MATGARPFDLIPLHRVDLPSIGHALELGKPWLTEQADVWLLRQLFGYTSFIAMDSAANQPAGVVVAAVEYDGVPRSLYVDRIAVAGPHRGRGVAGLLLDAATTAGRQRGATIAWMTTDPANPAAHHWKSLGFAPVDAPSSVNGWPVRVDFKGPGQDRIVFERRL